MPDPQEPSAPGRQVETAPGRQAETAPARQTEAAKSLSPVLTGIRQRCPTCGKGKLFSGYLKFNDTCDVCGEDFTGFDTADGPAFFVGFLALIVFAPVYFIMPILDLPGWALALGYIVLVAACIGFCLALLPPFKGVLANLQLHHRAEEARFEDPPSD